MLRAMDRWLPGYLASMWRRSRWGGGPRHLLVCIADHYEPFDCTILPDGTVTGGIGDGAARAQVDNWCRDYHGALGGFRDSDGMPPRHTFFYPWDEYEVGCLDRLAAFCRDGYGEVEIHLHHRNDSEAGVREKLIQCRDTYAGQHGLLGRRRPEVGGRRSEVGGRKSEVGGRTSEVGGRGPEVGGRGAEGGGGRGEGVVPAYAFVHGNWCLCNARPDGDWCGVDRELSILADTGCYADLTFPSAPSPTQPRRINSIYYGRDPSTGERGPQVARDAQPDDVMMISGPLGLNWQARKWGLVPRLENGEVSGINPASAERLSLWQRIGIHVPGRADWVVLKLHTHGAAPANRSALLGPAMVAFHDALAKLGAGPDPWQLHYVTARELFNIIKAAEAGCEGSPDAYRDYLVTGPLSGPESCVDEP